MAKKNKKNKKTKDVVIDDLGSGPEDDTVDTSYPASIPTGEGVDPLTAGVKIPNVEPNNRPVE